MRRLATFGRAPADPVLPALELAPAEGDETTKDPLKDLPLLRDEGPTALERALLSAGVSRVDSLETRAKTMTGLRRHPQSVFAARVRADAPSAE